MSSPFGMYGGFKYKTPQSRALGSITIESYEKVWDDQGKLLSKIVGDVSYLAAANRKTQDGVDQANENVIQQLQDMINDLIVILGGGGGASGIDFGDFKYVIQAIGSLFGFTDSNGKITVPVNLFQAAWHFFSNWILPVDNFQDAINTIVDVFIGTMLNLLGEIPIVGQAAQQLAALISDIRDVLQPLLVAIQDLFAAFSLDFNDPTGLGAIFSPLAPIFDALKTALDGVVLPDFTAMFQIVANWTAPFVQQIADVIEWFADLIHTVINMPGGLLSNPAAELGKFMQLLAPIGNIIHFVTTALNPLITPIQRLLGGVGVGSITDQEQNYILFPGFPDGSIADNLDWIVDTGFSRSADGTGSAMVVVDGTPKALRSGDNPTDRIFVAGGQTVSVSAFIAYENLVCIDADAIQLQIIPFIGDAEAPAVMIDGFSPTDTTLGWPGEELSGDWLVPANVTSIQVRIYITPNATLGTVWVDDAILTKSGKIQQSWISGLVDIISNIIAQVQAVIDGIVDALTGGIGTALNTIADLTRALLNIPFLNILGVAGPANIGSSILETINHLVGGFVGLLGGNATLSDIFNVGKQVSSNASQGSNAWQVVNITNNKSAKTGMLDSGESNFNLTDIAFSAASFITATQAASPVAFIRIEQSKPIGCIEWLGYDLANLTAFYMNVWKVNDDKSRTLVHHSRNILTDLDPSGTSTAPKYQHYLPTTPLAAVAGDNWEIEWVPVGTGSHKIVGKVTGTWLPGHPTSPTDYFATVRNNTTNPDSPPTTIVAGNTVASPNVGWFQVAINNGVSSNYYDPVTFYINQSQSLPVPKWANYVDLIPAGGGGAGAFSATIGVFGAPGQPGKINAATAARGTHFGDNDTEVVFICGDGGNQTDRNGKPSSLSLGTIIVTADGGLGGSGLKAGSFSPGQNPGDIVYNGEDFKFGLVQDAYASDGIAPGGGATGGGGGFSRTKPGNGGKGGAFVRFRQLPVDDESAGWDQTPPTEPNIEVDLITRSAIVIRPMGSVDG